MSPLIVARQELLDPFIGKLQRKESTLLLALGDSNTDNTNFTRGAKQWPELLHTELKNHYSTQGVLLLNSALSGNTVLDALNRFDTDVAAYKPSLTIFCLGSNDRRLAPDVFEKGFHDCIDRLEAIGSAVLVFTPAAIMERKPEPAHIWRQDKDLGRNVEIIRKIVATRNVTFIDLYKKIRDMEDEEKLDIQSIMADEVHFNALGHQLVCRLFAPVFGLAPIFAWEKEQPKP
jgi:lysophospholipase L1-like esterase